MKDKGKKRKLDVEDANYDEAQRGLEHLTIQDTHEVKAEKPNDVLPLPRRSIKRDAPFTRLLPRRYTQPRPSTQAQVLSDSESEDRSGTDDADDAVWSDAGDEDDDLDLLRLGDMTIRDFEVNEFLQTDRNGIVPNPPVEFEQLFVSVSGKAVWKALQPVLSSMRYTGKVQKCISDMTIWSPYEDLSRCILVYPAQLYNFHTCAPEPPTDRKVCKDWPRVGESRDLCFSTGGTWYYCGTYKCTGMSILRLEDLCKLDGSRSYALFNSLAQQTPRVLGGEFQRSTAKTMGAITKALRDLYWDGTLLIRCYGFQLVGYDEKVKAAFVKCQATVKQKKDKKRQKAQKKGGRKKRQRLS